MLNYIKSEFYRITNTSGIYVITGMLVLAVWILNICICLFGNQYATTSFSYSNIVVTPMIYAIMGAVIAYFLYEGSRRNGNLKNTISHGISRKQIFPGECIVSVIVSSVIMILTVLSWILSTELLLKSTGPVKLKDFLLEVPAVYFIAIAGVIFAILLLEVCDKSITGITLWIIITFIIPKVFLALGLRFHTLYHFALWFPTNSFSLINSQHVNTSECITAWDTANGMIRCMIGGVVGVILFSLLGTRLLKRRDL